MPLHPPPRLSTACSVDSDAWISEASDLDDSDAYLTDDSQGGSQGISARHALARPSMLGDVNRQAKVLRITTEAQLKVRAPMQPSLLPGMQLGEGLGCHFTYTPWPFAEQAAQKSVWCINM
jgi:hypothetical protein